MNEIKSLSLAARIGLVIGVLVVLAVLVASAIGLVSSLKDHAYQKREQKREEERQALEDEKQRLQVEKQRALTEAAEAKAAADVYKTVAESKRGDKARTIKELESIEQKHLQEKAAAEASGSSLDDAALRRELCERLAKRGYPPCPSN